MSNFKKEWNKSYSQGDNNILYMQAEVIKFLNRFVCKRRNNGTLTRHLNKEKTKQLRGLDFGCGIGTHAIIFNDFDISSFGIDISEVAVSVAIKNAKKKLEVIISKCNLMIHIYCHMKMIILILLSQNLP